MDWNAQIGRELRGLDGIVMTLLALAGLAERATGAPYPIQCVVFWCLRQADAVATEFVAGSACGPARAKWLVARMSVRHGCNPDVETDLASSLSQLARVVADMVTQLRRQAFLHPAQQSRGRGLGLQHEVPRAFGMTVPRVGLTDTS